MQSPSPTYSLIGHSQSALLTVFGCDDQIMDPKMDSGMLQAEYESFDALQPRLPEEVVGIMDQLLCHEVRVGHLRWSTDLLMTLWK